MRAASARSWAAVWVGDPDGGLAAGVDDLLGGPLEPLARAASQRKRDEPVEHLHAPSRRRRRQRAMRGVDGSRGSR